MYLVSFNQSQLFLKLQFLYLLLVGASSVWFLSPLDRIFVAPDPASWPWARRAGSATRGRDGGGRIGRLASFWSLRALHPRHVLHRPVRERTGWAGAGPGSQERRERGQRRGRSVRLHLEPRIKVLLVCALPGHGPPNRPSGWRQQTGG